MFTGNLSPTLTDTIKINGVAFDLTGSTVKFLMRSALDPDGPFTVNRSATVVSPAAGTVSYAWQVGDTDLQGDYRGWWQVTLPSTETQDTPDFLVQIVDHEAATVVTEGYVTPDAMKRTLEIDGTTYADADILVAIGAASRVIDSYKNTRFFPTVETRRYTAPESWDGYGYGNGWFTCSLPIYEMNATSGSTVSVDMDGDGVFETVWTRDVDYYLEPINAELTGKPWDQITLRFQSGTQWPGYQYGIQVQGSFGWATAPAQVVEACSILANRYLKRTRETPYGIVTVGTDAMSAARLGKIDPDVAFMLDQIYDDDTPLLIL